MSGAVKEVCRELGCVIQKAVYRKGVLDSTTVAVIWEKMLEGVAWVDRSRDIESDRNKTD